MTKEVKEFLEIREFSLKVALSDLKRRFNIRPGFPPGL
jgi:hypothetical protein